MDLRELQGLSVRTQGTGPADADDIVIDLRPPEAAPPLSDWGSAAGAWRRNALDAYERAHRAQPFRYAGVVRRASGLVIDRALLLVAVVLVNTVLCFAVRVLRPEWRDAPRWQLALGLFFIGAVDVAIWYRTGPFRLGTDGATFGMRSVGVVAVEPEDRGPVGASVSMLRFVARLVLSCLSWGVALVGAALVLNGGTHRWWTWCGLAVLGLLVTQLPQLWAFLDRRNQTVADRLTRTVVVRV